MKEIQNIVWTILLKLYATQFQNMFFAQYEDPNIHQNDIVEKLREGAHCIYKIKDFPINGNSGV